MRAGTPRSPPPATTHLTGLADLRVRPLALAHYLLSVPDETLRRTGHILIEMLEATR